MDKEVIASWSYDNITHTLVSYDNQDVAELKGQYIVDQGLGGAMWWEISGDEESDGGLSLVDATLKAFGSE